MTEITKALSFNPLEIGSTLQIPGARPASRCRGCRFNPLEIGSTLQILDAHGRMPLDLERHVSIP